MRGYEIKRRLDANALTLAKLERQVQEQSAKDRRMLSAIITLIDGGQVAYAREGLENWLKRIETCVHIEPVN